MYIVYLIYQCLKDCLYLTNVLYIKDLISTFLQVNLCQKNSFLNQLTHNVTTDCSFSTRNIQVQNMLCTKFVFLFLFWHSKQFLHTICSELVFFLYWTRNTMNNLSSYGLTEARMTTYEKDLPVTFHCKINSLCQLTPSLIKAIIESISSNFGYTLISARILIYKCMAKYHLA